MHQKKILITGGNAGIGKATAVGLARLGAHVTIASRNPERGAEAVTDIKNESGSEDVDQIQLDLASLDAIDRFADEAHERFSSLDVLINNAGVVMKDRRETADGFEMTIGVNHLGHQYLVSKIEDLLTADGGGRLVVLASDAHKFARGGLDLDDLHALAGRYGPMKAYGRSKLANILYTRELARRLDGTGVTVNSVHPGGVATRLGRDGDGGKLGDIAMRLIAPVMSTPAKGAETSIHVATDPSLDNVTGRYFAKSKEATPNKFGQDDAVAGKLWELSEDMLASAR